MERQKAVLRDHRPVKIASCRGLWKTRLRSKHRAPESAAGTKIGPLYPPGIAGPSLSPRFVIAQSLQREPGRRRRRTPRPGRWKGSLLRARAFLLRPYFRRDHPIWLVRFLSPLSVRAAPVSHSGLKLAGPVISPF